MPPILAFAFTIAIGFTCAGLTGSFYTLMTNRHASFDLPKGTLGTQCSALLTLVFAGPVIIMRNALIAQTVENRPLGWLGLSFALSSFWSLMSGVLVLGMLTTA